MNKDSQSEVIVIPRIWVAGEALIDLVPYGDSQIPIVGGGPANTAKALAKLGIPISFIGGISSDKYGDSIRAELANVDLGLSLRSDLPTALAIVSLDGSGLASYEFKLENTATFDFSRDWLPISTPEVMHIGTLATIIEPGASELFEWAKGLNVPIVFDPNVRPSVLADKSRYCEAVERWAGISSVVKLSSEDLGWLGYDNTSEFFELGAELVVVTHGADGLTGYTKSGLVTVPGVKVEVADTVGAGDTVGAVLVEGLFKYGFSELLGEKLFEVLTRAARAASITCSRVGANPPAAEELGA